MAETRRSRATVRMYFFDAVGFLYGGGCGMRWFGVVAILGYEAAVCVFGSNLMEVAV